MSASSAHLLRPKGGPRRFRNYLKPGRIVVGCALLTFGGWFVFGRDGLWDRHKLAVRFAQQETQIAELQQAQAQLDRYLSALTAKDPAAMERAARDYHMVAPGELIYEVKIDSALRTP